MAINEQTSTGSSTSTSETRALPSLLNEYNRLLGLNQDNYRNVLGAYQTGAQQLAQQLPGITQGYQGLSGDIDSQFGRAYGVGAADIGRNVQQQMGALNQGLVSRGLGNTTVGASLARGINYDAQRSYGALASSLANQAAQQRQQIGLAGLAQQMQGLGLQTGLAQNLMGNLAGYRYANTLGNLTGGFSTAQNQSSSSANSYGGGGGGGGYGGGGGGRSATEGRSVGSLFQPFGYYGQGGMGLGYTGAYRPPSWAAGYNAPTQPGGYTPGVGVNMGTGGRTTGPGYADDPAIGAGVDSGGFDDFDLAFDVGTAPTGGDYFYGE